MKILFKGQKKIIIFNGGQKCMKSFKGWIYAIFGFNSQFN